MADLEALEAAVDAESEGETTHDTGGPSSELIRRVGALRVSFEANTLEGAPRNSFKLFKPTARRETTVLVNRGLRLHTVAGDAIHFICALDGCWEGNGRSKTNVRCPQNVTSNAVSHLKRCHGIESKKTRVAKMKTEVVDSSVAKCQSAYDRDPVAFITNAITLWSTEHSIPAHALQSPTLNQVLQRLPGVGRGAFDRTLCRKLLLQQYLTVKKRIIFELKSAKLFFGGMPFICVNLDLYQDPKQNKKYMAIRISWVDAVSCKLVSRLVGARHYNPTFQEKNESRASDVLAKWYKSVLLDDYRISDDMVLGGSGDHGSDVKKVMREHCGTHGFQEWCISHMLNVALIEAFGTSHDKVS
jgi:hypothetical protein